MKNTYSPTKNKISGKIWNGFAPAILAAAIMAGGFFAAAAPAYAAHTATVTATPTLVAGGATDTYSFTVANSSGSANGIYKITVTAPTGFTITGNLACPDQWTSSNTASQAVCQGDPFDADFLLQAGAQTTVSFSATSPVSDSTLSWSVQTKDNAGSTSTNSPTVTVDSTSPTMGSVVTLDANGNGTIDQAIITFSEAVDDSSFSASAFTIEDIAATSIDTGDAADDDEFTLIFDIAIDGTEAKTLSYTAGEGADLAGNLLANAAVSSTDQAAAVAISAQTKTAATIEVTFSEDINGSSDSPADFSVAGSAVTATDELDGVVTLTLQDSIAGDAIPTITINGNGVDSGLKDLNDNWTVEHSVASTDGIAPVITSSQTISTTQIQVTFSEPMSAVSADDFTVADNDVDDVTFSPGDTTAVLILDDAIGTGDTPQVSTVAEPAGTEDNAATPNAITGNLASTPVDGIAPTVSVSSTADSPTNDSPIPMTATFSESVTGLAIEDIVAGNGSAEDLDGAGTTYTFNITASGQGEVTVDIPQAVAADAADNLNSAASQFSIIYDSIAPTVELTKDQDDLIVRDADTVVITAAFNEAVASAPTISIDVAGDDIDVAGAAMTGSGTTWTYTWDVPAEHDGSATATVVGADQAGNDYAGGDSLVFTIDNTAPTAEETNAVSTPNNNTTPDVGITVENGVSWQIKDNAVELTDGTGTGAAQTVTLPTLVEGIYNLTLVATDAAGNQTSILLSEFLVDTTTPEVNAGADKTTNTDFNQDATASDSGGSEIASYLWEKQSGPEGGDINFGSANAEDTTINASLDGTYALTLTVIDNAGNGATDTIELVWDTQAPDAPTVAITEIINDANQNAVSLIVGGEVGAAVSYSIDDEDEFDDTASITDTGTIGEDGTVSFNNIDGISNLLDGTVTAAVTLTDAAGNTSNEATDTGLKDTVFPVVSSITSTANSEGILKIGDGITFTVNLDSPEVGASVSGSYNGYGLEWAPNGDSSAFSAVYTIAEGDSDQISALQITGVVMTDAAGNSGNETSGEDVQKTIDANKPLAPAVSSIAEDNIINNSEKADIVVVGTAEPGSTVNVSLFDEDGVEAAGNGTAAEDGSFSISIDGTELDDDGTELADGDIALSATATDPAGNVSAETTEPAAAKDVDAPNTPTITNIAEDNKINAAEAGAIVVIGTAEAGSTVNISLTNGENTVAGNGTATDGNYSITIDGSTLPDGTITPSATATDPAGNQSGAADSPTADKDTVAPDAPVITNIADDEKINESEKAAVVVTGTAEADSTIYVSLTDGASTTVTGNGTATDGAFSITIDASTLADGAITPSATATDAAGNESAAADSPAATKDVVAPTVVLATEASEPTNVSPIPVTITFSESVTGFDETDITIEGGTVNDFAGSGADYTFNATPADNGAVTVSVGSGLASDDAGNLNTASDSLSRTYDNTTPTAALSETPADPTKETSTEITVAGDEVVAYKYKLDDGSYGEETSVSSEIELSGLADGSHTLAVIGKDAAGNWQSEDSPTAYGWTVDTVAPVVSFTSPAANSKVNSNQIITFDDNESTAPECSVDDDNWSECESEGTTLNDVGGFSELAEGGFTLYLRDTDAAGNVGSTEVELTKDTTSATITAKTPSANAVGASPSADITVTFSEVVNITGDNVAISGDVAKEVSFDSDTKVATINPTDNLSNNTTYTVTLSGITDAAGNSLDETSWLFTTSGSYSISLASGWNLISLPVVPSDSTNIATVLGTLDDAAKIESIYSYDAVTGEWKVYHPGSPETSTLFEMTAGYGYWVKYLDSAEATLSGSGNLLLPGNVLPPSRELAAGWNLIGYYQKENTTSVQAQQALANSLTNNWSMLIKYVGATFSYLSSSDNLNPGEGYWIFLTGVGGTKYNYTIGNNDT